MDERFKVSAIPPPLVDDAVVTTEATWRKAQGVLAAGLWSVSQGAFRYPDGVFPMLADRGEGCVIWDTTGRDYIDWMMGWGPVMLGYRHPKVEKAIIEQLRSGPLLSLLHPIEVEVAEMLRAAIPCAERVAFGKNGSDVLGLAVRIARAATGREGILIHGYHGFHDWYMAAHSGCEGIPESLRYLVHQFPYNDLEHLKDMFEKHGDRIAAVVMEPCNVTLPAPGYLEGIRELTLKHGALLIFDEIITSFRLARGGAQEFFGVVPDLACVGKGLANGMPLSALVGKRDVMDVIHRVGYGITYRGETLSLAAARACLEIYSTEQVAKHLATVGEEIRARLNESLQKVGVAGGLFGFPARMSFAFSPAGGITGLGLQTLFVQEAVKRGVLTNGNLLASYAHRAEALDKSAAAFHGAAEVLARAIEARSLKPFLHIQALNIFYEDGVLYDSKEPVS